jgi:hypothetical protein
MAYLRWCRLPAGEFNSGEGTPNDDRAARLNHQESLERPDQPHL